MEARRWLAVVVAVGSLFLTACSPLDQAAVTRDRATQQPALRLGLCGGETVSAVTLVSQTVRGDEVVDSETLWRIEATEPSRRTFCPRTFGRAPNNAG